MPHGSYPKAIFWDMDGTLVQSEHLWEIATYELSEKLGRRITPEVREATIGGSFENTLTLLADYAGVSVSAQDAERYRVDMFARVADLYDTRLEPAPGVRSLLEEFYAAGIPMMVTTNTPRELALHSVRVVGEHFFSGGIFGDDVTHPKPDPEMYLTAARTCGVQPQECWVFEDSVTGMTAGHSAGCHVIGVPATNAGVPGVHTTHELRAYYASHADPKCHGTHLEGLSADDISFFFDLFTS